MKPGDVLVGLSSLFKGEDLSEVISCLHTDPQVWDAICEDSLFTSLSTELGSNKSAWNPGTISLLAIGKGSLEEIISLEPLQPIPQDMRQQASAFFQKVLKSEHFHTNLTDSTLLAIALRERKRLTGTWNGLISEIVRSAVSHAFSTETWLTPFSILYAWFNQDASLISELTNLQDYLTGQEYFDFITHILLSQQSSVGEKVTKFSGLLQEEAFDNQVKWLKDISTIDFVLAQRLSSMIIASYQDQGEGNTISPNGAYNHFLQDLARQSKSADPLVSEEFDPDFSSLDQWIALFGIAHDDQQYNALLEYKKELLNTIQSGIQAYQLKKNISSLPEENIIGLWKDISEKTPQSDIARAEYAQVMLSSNRKFGSKDIQWGSSEEPLVLLTRAQISQKDGDSTATQELVAKAIEKSLEKKEISPKELERYAGLISNLGFLAQNNSFLQQVADRNVNQPIVYRLLAENHDRMGSNTEAIEEASIAIALQNNDIESRRMLARLYGKEGQLDHALEAWDIVSQNTEECTSRDLLDYAECAIEANQPDLAVSTCKLLLPKEPSNGEIYSVLGEAYSLKGDTEKAVEYFHRAVTITPENDRPWIKLVEYQSASEEKEKANDLLSRAINACPNSAKLAGMLGDYYIEEGSYSESIPYLKKAFSIEPNDPHMALKLGTTLQTIGLPDEAIEIFKEALGFQPDDSALLDAYTNVLIATSRQADSVDPLLRLISQHPTTIKPYLDLASYALANRETDNPLLSLESIEPILQEGLQLDPENITGRLLYADLLAATNREELAKDIYVSLSEDANLPADVRWKVNYGLGVMSTKLGEIDIALAALEEAGSQNPTNIAIHQKLAETYFFANLPKAATESAQAALAIAPMDLGNLIWYSEFCSKVGDVPEALSSLDAAIKQQPEKAELRMKLGELQLRMKDNAAARKTFQDLVAHGHLNAHLLRQVAKNLVEAGELDEAIRYLEFGIEQDPVSSLPLLLDLVKYEEKTGNISKAVTSIEKAIAIDPENIGLQVIKGDLLAASGQYMEAISTLIDASHQSGQQDGSFEIQLRLAYLNRANGDSTKALDAVEEALKLEPQNDEAKYLGADISFNVLDFARAGEFLHMLFQAGNHASKPISLLGCILDGLIKNESNGENESTKPFMEVEFPARWYLWQTAADVLLHSSKTISQDTAQIFSDLVNLSTSDIYNDLPLSDHRSEILPAINVYHPILSSPTMLYPILTAAWQTNQFATANSIISSLCQDYQFEPSTQYFLVKNLTLQAEAYQDYFELNIQKHLPEGDPLSVSSLDRFNEAVLYVKRYAEGKGIVFWEKRGLAAFHPIKENLEAIFNMSGMHGQPRHELQLLSLDNNLSGIEAVIHKENQTDSMTKYAATLIMSKAPAKAFEFIENSIENTGNDPVELARVALISFNAKEYEIALNSIEKALSIWPNEPKWHSLAAQICRELDNPSSALYHLKIAADLDPESFDTIFAMGEGAQQLGDPTQALQYLKIASTIKPTDHRPWFLIAKTYQNRGDNLQALANVERAVTLAPNTVDPLILSAQLSQDNNQPDQAIKKIDAALRIDPKNVDALVVKVHALKAVDQTAEAMKLIDYSIKKVSKPLPLLVEKAEMIRSVDGEKAYVDALQKIAEDYPKNPDILRLYALALAENGHPTEALNITQMSLKLNPDQNDMHILAGRLLRTTGQLDQALDHLSQAISQDPQDIDGYLEIAKTYQERRDYSKAVSVLQQAIDALPKDYRSYYQLGLIMKDSKDYHGAESMLRKAAELSRDDVNILRQLGAIIAINLVHPA